MVKRWTGPALCGHGERVDQARPCAGTVKRWIGPALRRNGKKVECGNSCVMVYNHMFLFTAMNKFFAGAVIFVYI